MMRTLLSICLTIFIMMPAAVNAAGSSSSSSSSSSASTESDYEYTTYGMRMAASYIADGDFTNAITQLTKEIDRRPDDADAWNLLGFSLRKSGDYSKAETAYQRALEIDPKHTRAMEYMGKLYLSLDMPEKTKNLLNQLNALCSFNCKDRDMLKKALSAYEAKN